MFIPGSRYCLKSLSLFLLILVSEVLTAQPESPLLFNNLKVKDGLPVNEIFTITQDETGFIWLGTINGFIRYDGYEMKTFRQDGSGEIALPDNQITSIEKDNNGGLWVGCYEGLIHFDTKTWKSRLVDLGGTREVRCLLSQGDSLLWVGTSEGLFRLDTRTMRFSIFNQENSKLGNNIVRALYFDSDENVWVGTFDGLNAIHQKGAMEFFDLKGCYKPGLKNNLILDIQPYSKSNDSLLWVGTETGLVLFNRHSKQTKTFNAANTGFGNEVVKCIYPLTNGRVFFGTDFGFYYFDSKTSDFQVSTHDPFNNYSLTNNVVWDIFEDNSGILWLATSNGVSQLTIGQSNFQFTPVYDTEGKNIVGNQVNDIYCCPNGTIWLATKKGVTAIRANGAKEVFATNSKPGTQLIFDNINTITGDNLGRIWIGSAGGINVWDKNRGRMYTITANFDLNKGLRSNYISAFITPPDGSFWVLTWGGGMYRAKGDFENVENLYFEYVTNINTNIFSCDSKKIWLKHDKKVYTIDLLTMQISSPEKLNFLTGGKEIYSMLISRSGYLWIGMNNQLLKYNIVSGEYQLIDLHIGKESYICNMIEDFDGDIWGTTLTSIVRFSVGTNQVETFPMNKGIPLDIFLSQSNAISASGQLFFGGNDGFIGFNPKAIHKNIFCPQPVISGLKVGNQQVSSVNELKGRNKSDLLVTYSDKVVLKYDQRSFTVSFSALHFADPGRNIYAYMLEGYDNDWHYTNGTKNFATYSNLSPDKYVFKVKSANNDGVWSDKPAVINIAIKPPVWASAMAVVIYIVILQLILIALFQTYRNKVRWKERLRKITVEKEKNEQISQAKQQFFTNISHEFRTPLNLIMGPAQTLLDKYSVNDESRSLLQLIMKNSKRLLSLVNQLLDIRRIENRSLKLDLQPIELIALCREQYDLFLDMAGNQHIHFHFDAPATTLPMEADPAKLESIIQNLLSNAFKFTPNGGKIDFRVEITEDKQIRFTIADTGKGIPAEDQPMVFDRFFQGKNPSGKISGYGIGLNLAKEYCELMNGSIRFESEAGKGTVFTVEIPVDPIAETLIVSRETPEPTISNDEQLSKRKLIDTFIPAQLPVLLLVDDHPDTLEYIKLCLAGKFTFLTSGNGREAFSVLEKNHVDLIISDIMMPEIDGLSLCEKVKSTPRFSNIPIVLLTAMAMASHEIDGLRAGADAYITKPFSIEVLEARINSLLARNQKVDEYIKRKLIIENQEVDVASLDEKLLKETIAFINRNISDPEINIDKMCKEVGVSHSSLYRKVKNQTGLTLNELIRHIKMQRAAQLIRSKKMSIAQVMDETGFTNHSYFAKCFKAEFYMSPRDYAANQSNASLQGNPKL